MITTPTSFDVCIMNVIGIYYYPRTHAWSGVKQSLLSTCQSVSHYTDQGVYQWCTPPGVGRFMEINPWACGPEGISNRCYRYPLLVNFNEVYMLTVSIAAQWIGVTLRYSIVTIHNEDFLNKLEVPNRAPTLCAVSRITGCGLCFVWNNVPTSLGLP